MLELPDASLWDELLAEVTLPGWFRAKQTFDTSSVTDVAQSVQEELAKVRHLFQAGMRVGIGVGSRGLASLEVLVRTTVEYLRDCGCTPVILPAMGSHGGATAAGQLKVLAGYGITAETVGAELVSSMAVTELGKLGSGLPVVFSSDALACDLIIPINRIKSHTSFRGPVESGLSKMLVIGFGRHAGAQAVHAEGYERFAQNILEARDIILQRTPFKFGLATVENAHGQLMRLELVMADDLKCREPELLQLAKKSMARLLFEELDILVVQEASKHISGLGMDPNVTGRFVSMPGDLKLGRLLLLDLNDNSQGNAIGLGLADITTRRVWQKLRLHDSWVNAVTSGSLAAVKLPICMASDELAIKLAIKTCGQQDMTRLRAVWIKNTASLETIFVSKALAEALPEGISLLSEEPVKVAVFDHPA